MAFLVSSVVKGGGCVGSDFMDLYILEVFLLFAIVGLWLVLE